MDSERVLSMASRGVDIDGVHALSGVGSRGL